MNEDIALVAGSERRRSTAADVQQLLNDCYVDLPTDGLQWRRGAWLVIVTTIGTLTLLGLILTSL
jgi:hypothetical protein